MRTRRSLVDLDDLTRDEIEYLFHRTRELERDHRPDKVLDGIICVNMFFEHSTRTMTSFAIAEKRLGADVITLWPSETSLSKGETIEDMSITLAAMGINVIVVRHPEPGYPRRIALMFDGHVINAGDGTHAHPTQALLDLYTLREEFGELKGRSVAIVGDILHSRVAHSAIAGLITLGVNVVLVGPEAFLPADKFTQPGLTIERDLDKVIPDMDAIVLLRIQRERFDSMPMSDEEYIEQYRLDSRRLALMPRDAIVMHPGPYNRGVELDDSVLTYAGWRYARQVMHGVGIRMAVLDFLVNGARTLACS